MSVAFNYLYRDGSNCKSDTQTVVFRGDYSPDELAGLAVRLAAAMDDTNGFMAHQVGVPEAFLWDGKYDLTDDIDHCWHEMIDAESVPTPRGSKERRTFAAFVGEVEKASRLGWDVFEPGDEDHARRQRTVKRFQARGKGMTR